MIIFDVCFNVQYVILCTPDGTQAEGGGTKRE